MTKTLRPNISLLLVAAFVLASAAPALAWTVPVAASFSTTVPANRQSLIQPQGSDAEGTSLVYATTTSPAHGALSSLHTATGYAVYTPTAGDTGAAGNTGSTTVRADSDPDGVGVIDLQTKGAHTGLRVENDGTVTLYGPFNGSNFGSVITAIGGSTRSVRVTTAQSIPASVTVPANVCVEVEGDGPFAVASGQTLTFNCLVAPARQVFSGPGSVAFAPGALLGPGGAAHAVWWQGDFGQRMTAAKNGLAAGGVVDARTLTGAQALSGDLVLDRPHTTYLLGVMTLSMGAHQIKVPLGADGVRLLGSGPGAYNSRTPDGTALVFSGTGNAAAIVVGGPASQTTGFRLEGCKVLVTSTSGVALRATNLLQGRIRDNVILAATKATMATTAGVELNGGANTPTTFSAFTEVSGNEIGHFKYGVFLGDASNAQWVTRNNIHGYPTTGGLAGGGAMTHGVYVAAASNTVISNDIEGLGTGLAYGPAARWNTGGFNTFEEIGTYTVDAAAGSAANVQAGNVRINSAGTVRDLGTLNQFTDERAGLSFDGTDGILRTTGRLFLRQQSGGAEKDLLEFGNDGVAAYLKGAVGLPFRIRRAGGGTAVEVLDARTTLNGSVRLSGISAYADNAAALAGGLSAGDLYRCGDRLCVVH